MVFHRAIKDNFQVRETVLMEKCRAQLTSLFSVEFVSIY